MSKKIILKDINIFNNSINKIGQILCIDFGTKKLGIAVSDTTQTIATPISIITRKNKAQTILSIKNISYDRKILAYIVGYPIEMSGNEGKACVIVNEFCHDILCPLSLPILLYDERFSTSAVDRMLRESSLSRLKRNAIDDKLASAYILQSCLEKLMIVRKEYKS